MWDFNAEGTERTPEVDVVPGFSPAFFTFTRDEE